MSTTLALAFLLAGSAEVPSTEVLISEAYEDCLKSMAVLGYRKWQAQRICDCHAEQLETLLNSPAEDVDIPSSTWEQCI